MRGNIQSLALINAFLSLSTMGANPFPFHAIDPTGTLLTAEPSGPAALFYNDLPSTEATYWAALIRPQSALARRRRCQRKAWDGGISLRAISRVSDIRPFRWTFRER